LEATGNTVAYNQVNVVARVEGYVQSIGYKDDAQGWRAVFRIEPASCEAKLQEAKAALKTALTRKTAAMSNSARSRQADERLLRVAPEARSLPCKPPFLAHEFGSGHGVGERPQSARRSRCIATNASTGMHRKADLSERAIG